MVIQAFRSRHQTPVTTKDHAWFVDPHANLTPEQQFEQLRAWVEGVRVMVHGDELKRLGESYALYTERQLFTMLRSLQRVQQSIRAKIPITNSTITILEIRAQENCQIAWNRQAEASEIAQEEARFDRTVIGVADDALYHVKRAVEQLEAMWNAAPHLT